MAETYSSLFKGNVHVTTPFSNSHKALDMGNYKTRNPIYVPNRCGNGVVSRITHSYTYNGKSYNALTVWIQHDNGYNSCFVHGYNKDQIVNVGDRVKTGQLVYRTGNAGYSFGDHLHYQLKKDGVLIDPAPIILNDKNVMTYPKRGQRIEWLKTVNIKPAQTTNCLRDSRCKVAKVGSVAEVLSDEVRTHNKYQYMDVRMLNAQGWSRVAYNESNNSYFKVTTKKVTDINGKIPPPEPTCEDKLKAANKKIAEQEEDIRVREEECEDLSNQLIDKNQALTQCSDRISKLEKDIEIRNKEIVEKDKLNDELNSKLGKEIDDHQETKELLRLCKENPPTGCMPFGKYRFTKPSEKFKKP